MGLMQQAVETFDCHSHLAGRIREGKEPLAPIGHQITAAQLEITLDEDGQFVSSRKVEKTEPKIIIPVTEDSAGRTSSPSPHPLCDQLSYLADYDEKRHGMYLEQLADWEQSSYSHPKLWPILVYVQGGTILADLEREGCLQRKPDGKPDNEKMLVRWRVLSSGEGTNEACWMDQSLFDAYIAYYTARQQESGRTLCMISGEEAPSAKQHPKGIIAFNGNAKLVSANDKDGFTYRGRFREDWQAATVSYTASQKAHNALRWVAAGQGVTYGGRTFLCWNPQGKQMPAAMNPLARYPAREREETDYRQRLKNSLMSFQKENQLTGNETAVIAAFDAATTGRLAVTYYNELRSADLLQRLADWDSACCWVNWAGEVQAPALWQLVTCAYGTQREEKGAVRLKVDDRVLKQQIQRLLACRVDGGRIPADLVKNLVQRASRPLAYDTELRERILFAACAAVRKYHFDRYKEEWNMSVDKDNKDRSYQFGRLLAVMEKAERDTYGDDERREPNAIRLQSTFCQRPMSVAANLEKQLERAYFPRLKPGARAFYKNLIGEILQAICIESAESEWNRPLEDTYLMGYYLQRNDLYRSKKDKMTEAHENEYTEE